MLVVCSECLLPQQKKPPGRSQITIRRTLQRKKSSSSARRFKGIKDQYHLLFFTRTVLQNTAVTCLSNQNLQTENLRQLHVTNSAIKVLDITHLTNLKRIDTGGNSLHEIHFNHNHTLCHKKRKDQPESGDCSHQNMKETITQQALFQEPSTQSR